QSGVEDRALMRPLPNFVVVQPADGAETEAAVECLLQHEGPAYLRLTRQKVADVTPPGQSFELGQAVVLREGRHLTLSATGGVVAHVPTAATELARSGIEVAVLNVHTLKPIDAATLEE